MQHTVVLFVFQVDRPCHLLLLLLVLKSFDFLSSHQLVPLLHMQFQYTYITLVVGTYLVSTGYRDTIPRTQLLELVIGKSLYGNMEITD